MHDELWWMLMDLDLISWFALLIPLLDVQEVWAIRSHVSSARSSFFNDNPSSSLSKLSFEGSPIWKIPKVSWIPKPAALHLAEPSRGTSASIPNFLKYSSNWLTLVGRRGAPTNCSSPQALRLGTHFVGLNFLAGTWYLRIGSNDFFCRKISIFGG